MVGEVGGRSRLGTTEGRGRRSHARPVVLAGPPDAADDRGHRGRGGQRASASAGRRRRRSRSPGRPRGPRAGSCRGGATGAPAAASRASAWRSSPLDLVELARLVVGVQEVGAVAHDAASIRSRRVARPRWAWALTEPARDAEGVGDLGLAQVEVVAHRQDLSLALGQPPQRADHRTGGSRTGGRGPRRSPRCAGRMPWAHPARGRRSAPRRPRCRRPERAPLTTARRR